MKLVKKAGILLIGILLVSSVTFAKPIKTEHQLDILGQTAVGEGGWFIEQATDPNWDKWYYTVTDLNHDGNLEILKAKSGFDDGQPQLQCEELVEGKWERHFGVKLAGSTRMPDILTSESAGQPVMIYEPKNKRYYYIFTEVIRHSEFDSTSTLYAISLDGDLSIEALASKEWQLSGYDGSEKQRFYRLTPLTAEISEDEYGNIIQEIFPGCEESGAQLRWWQAKELLPYIERGRVFFQLAEAYNFFSKTGVIQ